MDFICTHYNKKSSCAYCNSVLHYVRTDAVIEPQPDPVIKLDDKIQPTYINGNTEDDK